MWLDQPYPCDSDNNIIELDCHIGDMLLMIYKKNSFFFRMFCCSKNIITCPQLQFHYCRSFWFHLYHNGMRFGVETGFEVGWKLLTETPFAPPLTWTSHGCLYISDVAFKVGADTAVKTLTMQVHYKNVSSFLPPGTLPCSLFVIVLLCGF